MQTDQPKASDVPVAWIESPRKDQTCGENDGLYTISDLAQEFGVTLHTLRFYEGRSLLKPQRMGSTRIYSEEDRRRLKLIIKGKQLGFT